MAYFGFRESGDNAALSADENFSPLSNSIAGVKNPARASQPSMFNLLSWGDDSSTTRKSSEQNSSKIKPVVEDRWQSESQYQYCRGGITPAHKRTGIIKRASVVKDTEEFEHSPSPAPRSPDVALSFSTTPNRKARTNSEWKPCTTVTKSQRKLRTAKKRSELESLKSSRGVPDSAIAEVYHRPAFHNYGRCSLINPWVSKDGLETCNAQAQPKIMSRIVNKPEEGCKVTKHVVTSPSHASQRSHIGSTKQEIPPPKSPVNVTAAPSIIEVPPPPPPPLSMGSPKHVCAPRIVSPPVQSIPGALTNLSSKQRNDPKSYRCLNPGWTSFIKPAGTPNTKGESVSDCLHLFD